MSMDGRLSESPLPKISKTDTSIIFRLVSSRDIDPEIGVVLQWHLTHCHICKPNAIPPKFGQRATQFCNEYWEIINEYSEYESHYAWKGDV